MSSGFPELGGALIVRVHLLGIFSIFLSTKGFTFTTKGSAIVHMGINP